MERKPPQASIPRTYPKRDYRDKAIDFLHTKWVMLIAWGIVIAWLILLFSGNCGIPTHQTVNK
jgi:hypothetical protein